MSSRPLPPWLTDLRGRPVIRNAASLFGTTVITSVLGLGYSVAAARMFPISQTGIAFPALSAMQLLGQVGLLGIGTMLIGRLAQGDFAPGLVSAGAITATLVTSLMGVAFVVLQSVFSTHLGALGHGLLGPALFAAGCGFTALTLILDQATVGLGQTRAQLHRNGVFAIVKLGLLPVGALVPFPGAVIIYATWLAGNIVSLGPYWRVLRRSGITPVIRPHFPALVRERWTVMSHHWLNMADQAPRLLITVLVAGLLSPRDAAAFYAANLLVAFPTIIPVHLTLALFALPRGQLDRLANEARATLRVSCAVGLVSAVGIAAVAYPMLYVFGRGYVIAAGAMAVLGLNVLPYAVKVHYAAVERVHGNLRRCAIVSTIGALLEIGLCAVGAETFGLVGVSAGLVLGLSIEAVFLWPVVARAAQVPIIGNPSWLWNHEHDPDVHGLPALPEVPLPEVAAEAGSRSEPVAPEDDADLGSRPVDDQLRPDDSLLVHAYRVGVRMRDGSRRERITARLELPLLMIRVLRQLRHLPHHLLALKPTATGEMIADLMSPRLGPFSVLTRLRYVLELPPDDTATEFHREDPDDALRLVRVTSPGTAFAAYTLCQGYAPTRPQIGDERMRTALALADTVTLTALDHRGLVVGLGTALVDRLDAYLIALVARPEHPDGALARDLLHHALVAQLAEEGISRLWVDGPFAERPLRLPYARSGYRVAILELDPGIGW